jgi:hypothetical protein
MEGTALSVLKAIHFCGSIYYKKVILIFTVLKSPNLRPTP